jgi:hypothetical protein
LKGVRMRVGGTITLAVAVQTVAIAQEPQDQLLPVAPSSLCVTEGSLDAVSAQRVRVSVPKMRAYLNRYSSDAAEMRFTYLGPTSSQARLGSGGSREQFGLKLRAMDACNVVYVMWRLEPKAVLTVSVKSNSTEHSSAECGNRGYQNIKPRFAAAIPSLIPGDSHLLRAEIQGEELRVFVDGTLVWQGLLGTAAAALRGPVGLRSDNARLEFELAVENEPSVAPHPVTSCRSGPDEAE